MSHFTDFRSRHSVKPLKLPPGLALGMVLMGFTAPPAMAAPSAYTVVELGTLQDGSGSLASGINNRGQVVGQTLYADGGYRATLFSGTGTGNIDLGTLGGPYSTAAAINDSRQIVGSGWTADGLSHAALFSSGGNTDLGTLGGRFSSASDINNSGVIVGSSEVFPGGAQIATRFGTGGGASNVNLYYLDGHIGPTSAASVNAGGVIFGTSTQQTWGNGYAGTATIFIEGGDNGSNNRMPAYLEDYHPSSYAAGSNDLGQFVGAVGNAGSWTWTAPSQAALFTLSGETTGLGVLPGQSTSQATDINNRGQIIGSSGDRVFLWENGVMHDLGDLLDEGSQAYDGDISLSRINDWGQIAANVHSSKRALLLNPSTPVTQSSPGGDTRNTRYVAGALYAAGESTTGTGGFATRVEFLAGTAGSGSEGEYGLNRDVSVAVTSPGSEGGSGAPLLVSDVVSITGTGDDIVVISLSYDSLRFSPETVTLSWLDPDDQLWKPATEGNSLTPGSLAGWHGVAFSEFLSLHGGVFDAGTMLGAYGAGDGGAWAVINHNSEFAVTSIPEVSPGLLMVMAAMILPGGRRRSHAPVPGRTS